MKNKSINISAIIITKNEEKKLPDCLKSLAWVDEVIVVDSGSSDRTIKIAEKFKAKVINFKDTGSFADRRAEGLKYISGRWIIYVDADERVSNELKQKINLIVKDNYTKASYAIPRKNYIFGKEFKHCGQWPDYQKRLFYNKNLKGWQGRLHEEPIFDGELICLKGYFIHIKHEKLEDMVFKTNLWSEIEARNMFDAKHPKMNILRFTSAILRESYLRMIKQTAFLDGNEGIIYAVYQVYSRFISYAKLWEMQINSSNLKLKNLK
ncbi:hypothetical protein A2159_02085 [Candidatus Woesebacteria bacterium RBG_13_34_9]|uniref:Glycosyltransferase 2-like domain-containing protein n=1 Tax=Candidatus Woesebacteria bacterium RBG_13_34_9 TaxID=1802477 RepID=A0A1F7X1K1_9BACT|nr:MAG: hypothetical protein A2159_02085 [Candidatus Woesebacteria bacterium RBG_13_34_9]